MAELKNTGPDYFKLSPEVLVVHQARMEWRQEILRRMPDGQAAREKLQSERNLIDIAYGYQSRRTLPLLTEGSNAIDYC